jgi:peptidyl-prolyl cis-trans isomerase C
VDISIRLFEYYTLNAVQRDPELLSTAERQQLIEQTILITVLAQAAVEQGLVEDPLIAVELEYQRLQLLARAVTEQFRSDNAPTEAELRTAYEENLPQFLNTQFKARHILVETENEASALIAELDDGADFASLAQEHSIGPTGPDGGDLGWFSAESMVAPFAEAVRAATPGVHTGAPVQTRFGWHVILVEEVQEQAAPGLEAVRTDLTAIVERQKLDAYVQSLRDSAAIELVN